MKKLRTKPPAGGYLHKGYGFCRDRMDPWSDPKTRLESVNAVLAILEGRVAPSQDDETLQKISNVKGLFSRIARGDRPDWFLVANQMGYPSSELSAQVSRKLQDLRKAIKDGHPNAFVTARAWLNDEPVREFLGTFLDSVGDNAWPEAEKGWAYVFWSSNDKDLLAIGATDQSIYQVETELNYEFKGPGRFGVMAAWLVHDPEEVQQLLSKRFARQDIGADFYRVELGEAKKAISELLEKHDLLVHSPWHGDDHEPENEQDAKEAAYPAGP